MVIVRIFLCVEIPSSLWINSSLVSIKMVEVIDLNEQPDCPNFWWRLVRLETQVSYLGRTSKLRTKLKTSVNWVVTLDAPQQI